MTADVTAARFATGSSRTRRKPSLATARDVPNTGFGFTFATPEKFTLLSGEDVLVDYLFNRRVIHHFFCRDCGVESFARAKTKDGREMFAVNIRCLDGIDTSALSPKPFDGKSL
jgi:hypothetical protein